MHDYERFGDILIRQGAIKRKELNKALKMQSKTGGLLGQILVSQGLASEDDIASALAAQFWYPLADMATAVPEPEALALIPADVAVSRLVLPLKVTADEFHCVIADPLDITGTDWIQRQVSRRVVFLFASRSRVVKAINDAYALTKPVLKIQYPPKSEPVLLKRKPKREPTLDRQLLLDSLVEMHSTQNHAKRQAS